MKSALTLLLKRAFANASEFQPDRREFIRKSAWAVAALTLPLGGCQWLGRKPSVAIVGAGISGLSAAYQLKKLGIDFQIFEASGRSGGRVLTSPDAVIEGASVDFGAEFIDSTHEELISLATELNVELNDLRNDKLTSKTFFFEGKHKTEEDLIAALRPFVSQIEKDIASLPQEVHYSKAESFKAFDELSIAEYLSGLGMEGWLLTFFDTIMTSEYAMEVSEQSAINLLVTLSTPIGNSEHYHILGEYHEVLKFRGGSQKFIDKLSAKVEDQIRAGYGLKSLNKKENYELTFSVSGKTEVIEADIVLLTIPFAVLRGIEMNFKFPERKQLAIDTIGFGNGAKVAMGFNKAIWRDQGFQGYTFSDLGGAVIWDSSQMAGVTQGSLSVVSGGKESEELQAKNYSEIKEKWLIGADKIYPGLKDQFNGRISKFCWASHPFAKGSYTSYKKGQWSAFAGVESESFENIFFAGEHCSIKFQGFMNGAALSGRMAAEEIAKRLNEQSI